MSSKYTPGPWYRNINAKYPVYAGEAPNHIHIASILKDAPESEREANLRLITAAPELLEALKAIHGHLVNGDKATAVMTELARAAIAKARGEA